VIGMLALLAVLLFSGLVGFWLSLLTVVRTRRSLTALWALAPSTFFLAKAFAEGGSAMMLVSTPWAVVLLATWGAAALLGYLAARDRRRSYREG